MKASLLTKLETLTDRHEEVSALLGDSETIADQNKFRELSREYSELESVVRCYADYSEVKADLEEARQMLEDADPDAVSERAYQRGTKQLGTLGSGNHFLEIQMVDQILDESVAQALGLEIGQVTVMIHSGSR